MSADNKHFLAAADCGVATTKKACKNCTCGRADGQIEKLDLTPEMLENPQSGCGSVCSISFLGITLTAPIVHRNALLGTVFGQQKLLCCLSRLKLLYCSVGLGMHSVAKVAHIVASHHLKEERRLNCLMTSSLLTLELLSMEIRIFCPLHLTFS